MPWQRFITARRRKQRRAECVKTAGDMLALLFFFTFLGGRTEIGSAYKALADLELAVVLLPLLRES